jgi:hypothetical protein
LEKLGLRGWMARVREGVCGSDGAGTKTRSHRRNLEQVDGLPEESSLGAEDCIQTGVSASEPVWVVRSIADVTTEQTKW